MQHIWKQEKEYVSHLLSL